MPTLLSGFPDGFSARDEETSGCQGERLAEQHLGWGWIPPFSVGHPPATPCPSRSGSPAILCLSLLRGTARCSMPLLPNTVNETVGKAAGGADLRPYTPPLLAPSSSLGSCRNPAGGARGAPLGSVGCWISFPLPFGVPPLPKDGGSAKEFGTLLGFGVSAAFLPPLP